MRRRVVRGSEGQNQLEYIGLIVLVAAVVVALVAAPVLSSLPTGLRAAVCKVLGKKDCPEPNVEARPHHYYRPDKCLLNSSKTQYGASISVIATIGGDVALVQKVMSDGTVEVTAIQQGRIGIEGGVGADAGWGAAEVSAEANVGLNLKGGLGKTWRFGSQEEANEWVDNIRKNNRIDAVKKSGILGAIGGGVYDAFDDSDPREPDITRYKAGVDVYAEAGAGGGIGRDLGGGSRNRDSGQDSSPDQDSSSDKDGTSGQDGGSEKEKGSEKDEKGDTTDSGAEEAPGDESSGESGQGTGNEDEDENAEEPDNIGTEPVLEVSGRAEIGGAAIVEFDHKKHQVTTTFQYRAVAEGGGNVLGHDSVAGVPIQGKAGIEGAMKVTRTENGKLIGIEFVEATTINNKSTVTTTKLKIDNPRQRQAVEKFLTRRMAMAAGGVPTVPWVDTTPTETPGQDATPMERALYQEANITKAEYNTEKSPWQAGLEGKLGVKVGLEAHKYESSKDLISAEYLGAARNGGRRYVDYTECAK